MNCHQSFCFPFAVKSRERAGEGPHLQLVVRAEAAPRLGREVEGRRLDRQEGRLTPKRALLLQQHRQDLALALHWRSLLSDTNQSQRR